MGMSKERVFDVLTAEEEAEAQRRERNAADEHDRWRA